MRTALLLARLAILAALLLFVADARAEAPAHPWSEVDPHVATDIAAGHPLVTLVVVPLCSNEQIDCGSPIAGRPGDLEHNLYWGAVFGQRRFFERKNSGWTRVELTGGDGVLLERAIYRREVPGGPWGKAATVEQLVVLEAYHGAQIDRALGRFFRLSGRGGRVRFDDGGKQRDERVHVAGYAGHDRLMDGVAIPSFGEATPGSAAVSSFVMACYSEGYFGAPLRRAGSAPLVMTRALMAPEGYVVDAMARALADNAPRAELRASVVAAYAKWQRLGTGVVGGMFAKVGDVTP